MLNQREYCRSKGIGGEILNREQQDFIRYAKYCGTLCEEIEKLIDENAHLAAKNKFLQDELDALEDDGR